MMPYLPQQASDRESERQRLITMFGFTPTITHRCLNHLHVTNSDDPTMKGIFMGDQVNLDLVCDLFPYFDEGNMLAFINVLQMRSLGSQTLSDVRPSREEDASHSDFFK